MPCRRGKVVKFAVCASFLQQATTARAARGSRTRQPKEDAVEDLEKAKKASIRVCCRCRFPVPPSTAQTVQAFCVLQMSHAIAAGLDRAARVSFLRCGVGSPQEHSALRPYDSNSLACHLPPFFHRVPPFRRRSTPSTQSTERARSCALATTRRRRCGQKRVKCLRCSSVSQLLLTCPRRLPFAG